MIGNLYQATFLKYHCYCYKHPNRCNFVKNEERFQIFYEKDENKKTKIVFFSFHVGQKTFAFLNSSKQIFALTDTS